MWWWPVINCHFASNWPLFHFETEDIFITKRYHSNPYPLEWLSDTQTSYTGCQSLILCYKYSKMRQKSKSFSNPQNCNFFPTTVLFKLPKIAKLPFLFLLLSDPHLQSPRDNERDSQDTVTKHKKNTYCKMRCQSRQVVRRCSPQISPVHHWEPWHLFHLRQTW